MTQPPISALFVERDGVYYGLPAVDPWDQRRDARLYPGPYPVIAHPPCGKWSPLAFINRRRPPNYEIGDDDGCFEAALHAVTTWGGVLEHPASSLAWKHFGLQRPQRGSWQPTAVGAEVAAWVTEVDQGTYGHRARKRTWLLFVGTDTPDDLDWTPAISGVSVSGFLYHAGTDEARRVRPKEAARTPQAFRDVLISIAQNTRCPTPRGRTTPGAAESPIHPYPDPPRRAA